MTGRRRQVFDPNRLDDIDDLLPPPPPLTPPPVAPSRAPSPAAPATPATPAETPASTSAAAPARSGSTSESTRPTTPAPRQPRGQGGRPTTRRSAEKASEEASSTTRVAVPVRIPPTLYNDVNRELLAGPERPSYGQLVIWTCEDHPDEVVAEVRAARPQPGARRPRGHTLAAENVQITLRLTARERAFIDELAEEARPDPSAKAVTRTEIAIAALRLALQKRPS